MFILKRYYNFYKQNGLIKSLNKIILTPLRKLNKKRYEKKKREIFTKKTPKERFELIYKSNFWLSEESVSGLGSESINTENIRKKITNIINELKIEKILDAPCGDFNWIRSILNNKLKYIGADIVKNLIDKNNENHKGENINFITLDITKDKLPDSDLMICRDCLIHLSYKSIHSFFQNFGKSNIKYILLTSYKIKANDKEIYNKDIPDGEFREIDLSRSPFNLPNPLQQILDKDIQGKESAFNCYLNLYSKNQIIQTINKKI